MTTLGVIFPPDLPPERLRPVAVAADRAGIDQLWLWVDCFAESGIACAAAALSWTEQITVGIGLLPVPLRNVALTAMELASLQRLFPDRVVTAVGHGVQSWMGQAGARVESPMTLLREHTVALRALLDGSTVTTSGRYVSLTDVALAWPPPAPVRLLVGAVGERTLRLAGELGDGVILTGETTPDSLRSALPHLREGAAAGAAPYGGDVVVFLALPGRPDPDEALTRIGELVEAGATHVALLSVGDTVELEDFIGVVARDVRPRLT
jgi:alkanesulfonate monooxygenase SsuD/methylene tetrahydromethanopterin reductase-like flavin-dependent oxidoreductase (luciferase family)